MNGSDSEKTRIRCQCGAVLRVNKSAIGRKAKCPKCGETFVIEAPEPGPPASPEVASPDLAPPGLSLADDQESLLEDLARMEQSGARIDDPDDQRMTPCPNCRAMMPARAQICVTCGYDTETGQTHKAASARRAAVAGAARKAGRGAGTFLLGTGLSTGGALAGGAIWFVVAIITEYEIGYIAWGLGVLAGFGMAFGYRRANRRAGVVAGLIALVGIVAAKGMIFVYINYPELKEATSAIDSLGKMFDEKRVRLTTHRAELEAQSRGLSPDDSGREGMFDEHFAKVAALPESEVEIAIAELEAWEEGEKWNDPDYVRDSVIYAQVDRAWKAELAAQGKEPDEDDEGPTETAWPELYRTAKAEVEAMSAEDRLERARQVEAEQQRLKKAEELASHDAELRARPVKLPPWADEWETLHKEELSKHRALSDEELTQALADMEKWKEVDRWEDADYVRSRLIYYHTADAAAEVYAEWATAADEDWRPPSGTWERIYADAEAEVDKIPPDQFVERAKKIEAEKDRLDEEFAAEVQRSVTRRAAGDAFEIFLESYFAPFDVIFGILAVSTAFGIAARGGVLMED